jgi:hypothetical protein
VADEDHPDYAEGFEWDDETVENGNTAHLARRGIRPYEVEQMYANGAAIVPNKASGTGEWLLVGRTEAGRPLTIVMTYNMIRRSIRAFAGWRSTDGEIARYGRRERP